MSLDPDLERFAGFFGWERHLTPKDLERLAVYRMVAAHEEADSFALAYARDHWELAEQLEDAGDNPVAQAELRALYEMDETVKLCWGAYIEGVIMQ